MTIFTPDPTGKKYWVQARVEGELISVRIHVSQGFRDPDGTYHPPGMSLVDFRAPGKDWAWIDAHLTEIMHAVPLGE